MEPATPYMDPATIPMDPMDPMDPTIHDDGDGTGGPSEDGPHPAKSRGGGSMHPPSHATQPAPEPMPIPMPMK